jgi:hypothetical protein
VAGPYGDMQRWHEDQPSRMTSCRVSQVLLLLGAEESKPVFRGTGGGLDNLSSRQALSTSGSRARSSGAAYIEEQVHLSIVDVDPIFCHDRSDLYRREDPGDLDPRLQARCFWNVRTSCCERLRTSR